jgi:hypothetical protein
VIDVRKSLERNDCAQSAARRQLRGPYFLDDAPEIFPNITQMSVHGVGRGGGEKVAGTLQHLFAARGRPVRLVRVGSRESLRTTFASLRAETNRETHLFLTAGPRDTPLIVFALRRGLKFSVYLQVPYAMAWTWRDPIHAASIFVYLTLVNIFAVHRFVNSDRSAVGVRRGAIVMWPIARAWIKPEAVPVPPAAPHGDIVLTLACRLFPERGRGARDLHALERLLEEICAWNREQQRKITIVHFGDVHPTIWDRLTKYGPAICFRGFSEDWVSETEGPAIFLSKYEGFGLAPFEAAQAGRRVFVNEAFPDDLLKLCTSVTRLDTRCGARSILQQILSAPDAALEANRPSE